MRVLPYYLMGDVVYQNTVLFSGIIEMSFIFNQQNVGMREKKSNSKEQ
jgi:hypothetical protein